jgi:protein-disulfide isomerase
MSQHRPHFRLCRGYSWLLFAAILAGLILPSPTVAAPTEMSAVVATVQDQPISAEELTTALRSELIRLEMERYQIMKQKLDELIAARLLRLEAAKRGVPTQQLEQEEIIAKVPPVSPEQVKAFYEANKNRIRQPLEQISPRIKAYLQQQEQQKQQRAFLKELRQRYPVTIALQAPIVDVDADDDPFQGPENAPVTIIEFSDFQCPYCRRVQPTLQRLLHEYQGLIRLVFRDFPLRNIHPQAQKAHEAAQCAAEQKQFWAYHDKLFATSRLQVQDLKQYAQELGLDPQQFNACLDSGTYAREVEGDLQAGANAGVSATPSFFINGQPASGAIGYDRFKELVDTALEQVQSATRTNP